MGKKKREPSEPFELTRNRILLGSGIFVVFALIGIGAFTYFGDTSVSKSTSTPQFDVPAPAGPEPETERSAAADLLAGKSFADMSPEEVALVKSAVGKAFDNAQFRTTNSLAPLGLDIFRVNGVTRASRQYQSTVTPGGPLLLRETLVFYCDDPSGKINEFEYETTTLGVHNAAAQLDSNQLPFTTTISALDWAQPEDLGFDKVDGHRVHGVALPFVIASNQHRVRSEQWFDVDSARLIARTASTNESDPTANVRQLFDWRQPQPLVIPADQPVAPCAEMFYDSAPSLRPPPTDTPSADAVATATAMATNAAATATAPPPAIVTSTPAE